MKTKKVILDNGKEIETLDVIHNNTTTYLSFKDRVRVLFGKPIHVHTEIFTAHEECLVLGSKNTACYVDSIFPKKSQGGGELMTSPVTPANS